MASINKGALALVLTSGLVLGFGQLQSAFAQNANTMHPPRAYVVIDGKRIDTVINGYQWSVKDGAVTHATIADAAFDPAPNLKPISVKRGSTAKLSFQHNPPTSMQLDMWEQGKRHNQQRLNSNPFALPNKSGDYTYEITGNWGKDYVQYDFEIQVH